MWIDDLSNIDIVRAMTSRFDRFEAGDVVAIPFGVGLSHYGLVTSRGTVIANCRRRGGVVEPSFAEFANGRRVRLCERTDALNAAAEGGSAPESTTSLNWTTPSLSRRSTEGHPA